MIALALFSLLVLVGAGLVAGLAVAICVAVVRLAGRLARWLVL